MSWMIDQPEMMWDAEAYLSEPFGMSYDDWLSLPNAPIPEHEEIYHGGEEVFVLIGGYHDILLDGQATGMYKWYGSGFYTGVMVEREEIYMELQNVWMCVNEDVE